MNIEAQMKRLTHKPMHVVVTINLIVIYDK